MNEMSIIFRPIRSEFAASADWLALGSDMLEIGYRALLFDYDRQKVEAAPKS